MPIAAHAPSHVRCTRQDPSIGACLVIDVKCLVRTLTVEGVKRGEFPALFRGLARSAAIGYEPNG